MEIIAKKSIAFAVAAWITLIFGAMFILSGVISYLFPDAEALSATESVVIICIGAAAVAASVPLFIKYLITPKILAYYQDGVYHFPDFECKSDYILNADYKLKQNKSGTLIVYAKDGAHAYKNVDLAEFAYDKLAILILKDEGLLRG